MKMSPLKRLVLMAATGFGLGYSPVASGTAGTLPGFIPVFFLFPLLGIPGQIAVSILMAIAAVPLCHSAEKVFGVKDDGRIVADEYLAFPLCFIGLIGPETAMPAMITIMIVGFLSFRFFDVVKPPPARQLQRIRGGLGIVIDDVFAAIYSLAFNHAAIYILARLSLITR